MLPLFDPFVKIDYRIQHNRCTSKDKNSPTDETSPGNVIYYPLPNSAGRINKRQEYREKKDDDNEYQTLCAMSHINLCEATP